MPSNEELDQHIEEARRAKWLAKHNERKELQYSYYDMRYRITCLSFAAALTAFFVFIIGFSLGIRSGIDEGKRTQLCYDLGGQILDGGACGRVSIEQIQLDAGTP